jgi:SSS family solute:Na+ symporter
LLHRGEHAIVDESRIVDVEPPLILRLLGMGREFTRGDRMLTIATYALTALWTIIFAVGTIYNLTHPVADEAWERFWRWFLYIQIALASIVLVWFTLGGVRDLRAMLRRLATLPRNAADDGYSGQPGSGRQPTSGT